MRVHSGDKPNKCQVSLLFIAQNFYGNILREIPKIIHVRNFDTTFFLRIKFASRCWFLPRNCFVFCN